MRDGDLRDAGLEIFNRFPLGDLVFAGRPVVVQGRRQVGQVAVRADRRRQQRRHRFQLYAKPVVRVVRIDVRDGRHRRFRAATAAVTVRERSAERPELGQHEPSGVSALLYHVAGRAIISETRRVAFSAVGGAGQRIT